MIRLLVILYILLIGPLALAETEWNYDRFPIVPAQTNDLLPSDLYISKIIYHGLMPRGSGTHPFWGVEQVYADKRMTKRLMVKREVGVTGTSHSGWMKVGNGFVLHLRQGSKLNAFYSLGFDSRERLEIERQLRGIYRTTSMMDFAFPEAQAAELINGKPADTGAHPSAEKGGTDNEGSEGLTMCIGKMTGSIIANKVGSAYHSAADAVSYAYNDKLGAAKAVGNYVGSTAYGVWDSTKSVVTTAGQAVVHPVDTWNNASAAVDSTRRFANEIYSKTAASVQDFPTWPQAVKDVVTCSIASEIAAGGAEMIAGIVTGAGGSMAAIRAVKLLASIYERIKVFSPVIKLLIASKEGSWASRLDLLKDLVKGSKTREEVELALHKTGTPAVSEGSKEISKDAGKVRDLKSLSPQELVSLQAKNRALGDVDRIAAIEKQLGLPPGSLTDAQKKKLLDIHNKPCAQTACTAQEIKDLKDLKVVKEMFPNVSPQDIKDLYRGNLLGSEKDEFAALLKSSFKPRAEVDEGARLNGQLAADKADLESANASVAKLAADTDHSPIAMADAKRRQAALEASVKASERDLARHSLATTPYDPAHAPDEFKQLLKSSFKPKAAAVTDTSPEALAAAKAKEERISKAANAYLDRLEALEEAKRKIHVPPTEAELNEFNSILKTSLKPTASASQKLSEKLSYASSENPIAAKYVSPKTGQVVNADIVGLKDGHGALDASGEINHSARVLVRTTGDDGRTVTREIELKDLAFGHDQKAIGAQGGARSIDHAVDRLVERATSSNERIGELERQSQAAARAGDFKPGGAWDKAETEKAHLLKADQPLTHDEVRHIEAVHEAFTKENIARRMPLDISKTGDVTIRASGSMNQIGLTDAELKDIRHVKSIAEARNHAPRAIEDAQHFEKIKNLDEKKIVTDRIDAQRSVVVRRMIKFVQGAKCCAFPQNLGVEFQPSQLAKAYGAKSSSAVESITKVQKLLKKSELTSLEASEIRQNLRSLRSSSIPANAAADVNLNSFLDFAADRVGYERLNELSSAYKFSN